MLSTTEGSSGLVGQERGKVARADSPARGSVWDLDRTVISADTFVEQLVALVIRRPWLMLHMCGWLVRGRGYCKGQVADLAATPPESWPVRPEAVARILADQAAGCTTVLATAAHWRVAEPFARHLGCFDAVLASDDRENLKTRRKAAAIATFASKQAWQGYSYAGDCMADLAVWQAADEVVVVNPTPKLVERLRKLEKPLTIVGVAETGWDAVLKACRPHQWVKNLLLFLPMMLAHRFDIPTASSVAIAFVAFSLCASGVYVLNDIGDVAADRQHPRKRLRPIASGRLTVGAGLRLAALLFAAGLALSAALLPLGFLGLMLLYLTANLAYSVNLKQVPILDVLMLACMYALRLEAGAVAAGVPLSHWCLTFSLFFFTSLAFAKRFTELCRLQASGDAVPAGRGYDVGDIRLLEMLGSASGYVSVLVLALYMNSDQMRALYGESRLLWLVCPMILYFITRLWLLANRGQLDEDPVVFAIEDRTSLGLGIACGMVLLLATVLGKRVS